MILCPESKKIKDTLEEGKLKIHKKNMMKHSETTETADQYFKSIFNFNIDPYLRTNVALVPVLPEMKVNLFNP